MSIESRINSMEQNIRSSYHRLEDLGIDLTDIDKNLRNLWRMLGRVYYYYPKVTATGVTSANLSGTKSARMNLDIKGNSTQDETPAPNNEVPIYSAGDTELFDITKSSLGVYLNAQGTEGSSNASDVSGYMPVKNEESYILNYDYTTLKSSNARAYCFYDNNKQFVSAKSYQPGIKTLTITSNIDGYTRITYDKNFYNISFNKDGLGTISEKIVNKNLLPTDVSDWEQGSISTTGLVSSTTRIRTKEYYFVKFNTSYYISTENTNYCFVNIYFYDINKNFVEEYYTINQDINGARELQVNVPNISSIVCMKVILRKNSSTTITPNEVTDIKPMIVEGTAKTDFVAHQEQTYTIPVQQPMRSIGTVRDEFIQDTEGNWYERHNVLRYYFTGNENWLSASSVVTGTSRFYIDKEDVINQQGVQIKSIYSNRFKALTWSEIYSEDTTTKNAIANFSQVNTNNHRIVIRIDNNIASTIAELRTFLQNNETYCIYELETPVDLPCTEEQIEYLENLPKSYNEQTNIYSLDVTPAYFDASALKA